MSMNSKSKGILPNFEIKKISHPTKKIDAVVLEFDDAIARDSIIMYINSLRCAGYIKFADELLTKYIKAKGKDVLKNGK